jgi:hypothetical protein
VDLLAEAVVVGRAISIAGRRDESYRTRHATRRYNGLGESRRCAGDSPGRIEEFEAASRRPLAVRMWYAFIKTYRPVLDDEPFRAFGTMADYRRWCETALPDWLGFGRVR